MKKIALLVLAAAFFSSPAHAFLHHGVGGGGGGTAPVPDMAVEIVGLDYPNNGTTTALSGVSTTLTVRQGTWLNNPTSFTYNWHTVNAPGTSLGTGTTLTINTSTTPALVGQAIEVDETATNPGGSFTQMSHWFGPIELAVPVARTRMELSAIPALGTGSLPTQPTNFLQNGHAIAPGAVIPPASPTFTSGAHVWYFDPVNGTTQDAGATGHLGSPFNDLQALLNAGESGYSGGKLFARTIAAGDTIYVEPGNSSHPLGAIAGAAYSTNTGFDGGTINFTWILPDPAATSKPVLTAISMTSSSGFIFNGFSVENYRAGNLVNANGSEANQVHDILFENLRISQWLGHSNDPWNPSSYPTTLGSSDGTVLTASPTFAGNVEDPSLMTFSGAAHATTIAIPVIPPFQTEPYIWSINQIYDNNTTALPGTGIPAGTKISAVNGLGPTTFAYSNGVVNAFQASQLTSLTEAPTSPLTTAPTVPSQGTDPTVYYRVASSGTVAQSIYTYNGTAWASLGSIPPAAPVIADLILIASINNHVLHWTGTVWADLGTPKMTIAPCDPVADHATGCPAAFSAQSLGLANVPGCDPYVTYPNGVSPTGGLNNGACTGGAPIAWNGLTRTITNERTTFTTSMTITPAGSWNYADWDGGGAGGIIFQGTASATQINPAQPNNFVGAYFLSAKDNWIRYGALGMADNRSRDSIMYNNRIKYFSVDAIENYGGNGNWIIHNLATDVAFLWAHQDFDQFGTQSGVEASTYFADASMENVGVQYLDPTNWFPREMQGINTTDDIYWGTYVCCNLMIASTNGINIGGQYNAVLHNTEFPSGISIGNQPKSGQNSATYGLLANNIANGVSRQTTSNTASWTPSFCTVGAGDFNTVEGNMSIPGAGLTGATSSIVCTTGFAGGPVTTLFSGVEGNWTGLTQWEQIDWQSNAGVQSLFNAYHPIASPVEPNPGWTTINAISPFNLCLQIPGLYNPATCQANGNIDLSPNASFAGWTPTILGTLAPGNSTGKAFDLPTGTAVGAYAIVTTATVAGIAYPSGVWQNCPTGSGAGGCPTYVGSNPWSGANGWYFISGTVYNPGIKNTGTNLGSGAPIADLFGHPWTSTPSIGAVQ